MVHDFAMLGGMLIISQNITEVFEFFVEKISNNFFAASYEKKYLITTYGKEWARTFLNTILYIIIPKCVTHL